MKDSTNPEHQTNWALSTESSMPPPTRVIQLGEEVDGLPISSPQRNGSVTLERDESTQRDISKRGLRWTEEEKALLVSLAPTPRGGQVTMAEWEQVAQKMKEQGFERLGRACRYMYNVTLLRGESKGSKEVNDGSEVDMNKAPRMSAAATSGASGSSNRRTGGGVASWTKEEKTLLIELVTKNGAVGSAGNFWDSISYNMSEQGFERRASRSCRDMYNKAKRKKEGDFESPGLGSKRAKATSQEEHVEKLPEMQAASGGVDDDLINYKKQLDLVQHQATVLRTEISDLTQAIPAARINLEKEIAAKQVRLEALEKDLVTKTKIEVALSSLVKDLGGDDS